MKSKETAFLSALAIIIVLGLLTFSWIGISHNEKLKIENQGLQDKIDSLETSLNYENLMNLNDLKRQFELDCRYRNYSFYIDDIEGSFCCKWINESRICQDWLTIVNNVPITVDTHNFITDKNATILIQSNLGYDDEISITLKKPKYDRCDVDEYTDKFEMMCYDYD